MRYADVQLRGSLVYATAGTAGTEACRKKDTALSMPWVLI